MSILLRRSTATRYPLSSIILSLILPNLVLAGPETEHPPAPQVREEMWAIPSSPVPMLAYLVRPVGGGGGPFPLVVMNHGVSLDATERSYFPVIEFRNAALWFARQGYVVVAPVRPGYGATAIEIPERGLFGLFFSGVGKCSDAEFRNAGLAVASIDKWIIEYMSTQSFIKRNEVFIVGQSGVVGGRLRLAVKIRNLCERSSVLQPAAVVISMANLTTTVLPIS
jgi:dienelactone hydrolase